MKIQIISMGNNSDLHPNHHQETHYCMVMLSQDNLRLLYEQDNKRSMQFYFACMHSTAHPCNTFMYYLTTKDANSQVTEILTMNQINKS